MNCDLICCIDLSSSGIDHENECDEEPNQLNIMISSLMTMHEFSHRIRSKQTENTEDGVAIMMIE